MAKINIGKKLAYEVGTPTGGRQTKNKAARRLIRTGLKKVRVAKRRDARDAARGKAITVDALTAFAQRKR